MTVAAWELFCVCLGAGAYIHAQLKRAGWSPCLKTMVNVNGIVAAAASVGVIVMMPGALTVGMMPREQSYDGDGRWFVLLLMVAAAACWIGGVIAQSTNRAAELWLRPDLGTTLRVRTPDQQELLLELGTTKISKQSLLLTGDPSIPENQRPRAQPLAQYDVQTSAHQWRLLFPSLSNDANAQSIAKVTGLWPQTSREALRQMLDKHARSS